MKKRTKKHELRHYFHEIEILIKEDSLSFWLLIAAPLMTLILNLLWYLLSFFNPSFLEGMLQFFSSGSLFATIMTTAITTIVSFDNPTEHLKETIILSICVILSTLTMGFINGYGLPSPHSNNRIFTPIVIIFEIITLASVTIITAHYKASQRSGFVPYSPDEFSKTETVNRNIQKVVTGESELAKLTAIKNKKKKADKGEPNG